MNSKNFDHHVKLLLSFFKNRPMKTHWIQLQDDIKLSLEVILDSFELSEVSSLLEVPLSKLKTLKSERAEIELIMTSLQLEKDSGKSTLSYTDTKQKVIPLLYLLPGNKLSTLLGIPRSTISTWKGELKKKSNVKEKTTKKARKSTVPKMDIAHAKELKDLQKMIERHHGKISRKYSQSEKDLILKLVDRFGSKLVHQHTKVSFDTISSTLIFKFCPIILQCSMA
jgi:hypothetical protein